MGGEHVNGAPTDPESAFQTDAASLLARDGRLRALARALVRDPATADDLAQEAWLALLERGSGVRALSAWLATLVRRAATRERRDRTRRERREAAAARGGSSSRKRSTSVVRSGSARPASAPTTRARSSSRCLLYTSPSPRD